MIACANCHIQIPETSRFCSSCGQPNASTWQVFSQPGVPASAYPVLHQQTRAFHGGFGQVFGLDPRVAFLTVVVDSMLFGGQIATLGASTLVSVPAGFVLAGITYRIQRHWYRDDRESAIIKALIVGLLTALPTSLPGLLTIPSGIIGLVHLLPWRRKTNSLMIDRQV
jgi:uncharacterized membrane protein YedE/YeeE